MPEENEEIEVPPAGFWKVQERKSTSFDWFVTQPDPVSWGCLRYESDGLSGGQPQPRVEKEEEETEVQPVSGGEN